MSSGSSASNDVPKPTKSYRDYIIPGLTTAMHATAPFISVFVIIHLAAPVSANFGGSSAASKLMLLGREYYQTPFGETFLLAGPIAIHYLSGITKRLISPSLSRAPSASVTNTPRPLKSLLSITAYATTLVLLPIHFLVHRQYPTSLEAPISAVGPAELDWEFVKYGLSQWPVRNWLLYGGLVTCVLLHAVEGGRILYNTYSGNRLKVSKKVARAGVLALEVLPVLAGLYFVSREPLLAFAGLTKRFKAVFETSFIYRV